MKLLHNTPTYIDPETFAPKMTLTIEVTVDSVTDAMISLPESEVAEVVGREFLQLFKQAQK